MHKLPHIFVPNFFRVSSDDGLNIGIEVKTQNFLQLLHLIFEQLVGFGHLLENLNQINFNGVQVFEDILDSWLNITIKYFLFSV